MRVRDEAGQAGAEYVGGLLVVALIVGVLLTAGLGDTVAYATERAVACIVGGGCPAGAEDVGGGSTRVAAVRRTPQEAPACLLTSHAVTYTSTADFLFNRSVNGSTYLHAVHSDDVTEIRSTDFEGSGTVVMVGGELPIGGGRLRVSAGGSSVSVEEEGHVFLLDTEEAAEYQFWTEKLAQERYMAGPLPDWETQQKIAYLEAIRLGYADRRYTRTGSETEIEIGGAIKVIYGELTVSGASGVAVEEDTRTGATTVTFDIAGDTAGELGVMLLGGPVASAESGLAVSLETDAEGNPVRLAVSGATELSAGAAGNHDWGSLSDFVSGLPSELVASAGSSHSEEEGEAVRVTAELDLTDPETQAAALAFADDPSPATSSALLGHLDDSGSVLVERFETEHLSEEEALSLGVFATAGASTERDVTDIRLADAWSWDPVNGPVRLGEDCV